MTSTYGLYQTFSNHEQKDDLSLDEKIYMKEIIHSMTLEQKKAVLFLIIEHAKIEDEYVYNSENFSLPYGLSQPRINSLEFELDNLPIKLKWILFKFSKLLKNEISA